MRKLFQSKPLLIKNTLFVLLIFAILLIGMKIKSEKNGQDRSQVTTSVD